MSSDVVITSPANPSIKRLKALLSRRRRRYQDRQFVAEGWRTVTTLIDQGSQPDTLFVADGTDRSQLPEFGARCQEDNARLLLIDDGLLSETLDTVTPQSVAAIFKMRPMSMPAGAALMIAVDGVQDPGNLGTIIRTATAAGVDAVVALPGTVDLYNPKVVRASAGLVESLPVIRATTIDNAILDSFDSRPSVVVAEAGAPVSYLDYDWNAPTILVVGSEAHGARPELQIRSDTRLGIPVCGGVESLNVAAATAIFLFEARRHRQFPE